MEVMSTGTKGLQTYIMNRLLVYMYREFRAGEKRGSLPCIRADELSAQFPNISESFLRKRLKHCADLQVRLAYGSISGICYFFFLIPKEPSMAKPLGLSMGAQTLRC